MSCVDDISSRRQLANARNLRGQRRHDGPTIVSNADATNSRRLYLQLSENVTIEQTRRVRFFRRWRGRGADDFRCHGRRFLDRKWRPRRPADTCFMTFPAEMILSTLAYRAPAVHRALHAFAHRRRGAVTRSRLSASPGFGLRERLTACVGACHTGGPPWRRRVYRCAPLDERASRAIGAASRRRRRSSPGVGFHGQSRLMPVDARSSMMCRG